MRCFACAYGTNRDKTPRRTRSNFLYLPNSHLDKMSVTQQRALSEWRWISLMTTPQQNIQTNPTTSDAGDGLGSTLFRVAWLAILLGFAMEALLLLLTAGWLGNRVRRRRTSPLSRPRGGQSRPASRPPGRPGGAPGGLLAKRRLPSDSYEGRGMKVPALFLRP